MDMEKFELTPEEEEGMWRWCLDYRTGEPVNDAKVLVAADNCTRYTEATESYTDSVIDDMTPKPGKYQRKGPKNSGPRRRKANLDAVAKYVFLDFQGLTRAGKPLTNNEATRRELLNNRQFADMIAGFAAEVAELQGAELGNSKSSPEDSSG